MRLKTSTVMLYPLLAAALVVAVMIGLTWMLTSSKRATLSELREKYHTLMVAQPATTPQDIQATITKANAIVEKIPADNDISELLSSLGRDLDNNQTTDRQLTTGRATGDVIQQIPIQVRFSGSFDSTCRLLRRLDEYPRLIRVDQMTMQRIPEDATAKLNVELNLSTFIGDMKRIKP